MKATLQARYFVQFSLFLLTFNLFSAVDAATMYQCKDANGKPFFTDKKRLCVGLNEKDEEVNEVELSPQNLHSQYGSHVSEEYYNYAYRDITRMPGYAIDVYVETRLIEEQPALVKPAIRKMEKAIVAARKVFPGIVRPHHNTLKYFIFTGDESRTGGRKGGFWYMSDRTKAGEKFHHSIVARSAADLVGITDERAFSVAVHEMAHAYHYKNWKRLGRKSKNAYDQAKQKKLYLNVPAKYKKRDYSLKKAYAMTNHVEYFAELSSAYFSSLYYHPFNHRGLKTYDPVGYQMIQQAYYPQ